MLGIDDTWVLCGYLLCLASAALCIVYGFANWNRGSEAVAPQDIQWTAEEDQRDRRI
jgi:hypothetical protein